MARSNGTTKTGKSKKSGGWPRAAPLEPLDLAHLEADPRLARAAADVRALLEAAAFDPRAAYEAGVELARAADEVKAAAVAAALRARRGLQAPAAAALGIGRSTLQYWMKRDARAGEAAIESLPEDYHGGRPPRV